MHRFRLALPLALAVLGSAPGAASAAGVDYPDGDWSQATIPSTDGVTLHADVLRPKGLKDTDRTPVVLSIGPYFNHSGQVGPAGPAEDTTYDPVGPSAGPSERFQDFVEGSGLLKKGYTFVMVDLRGFGGSTGCLDWAGPGEQADVVNAVQWAASQPWSTGKVGMYGKSYDAMTGLIGVDKRPAGLAAVVAQEPVYDVYRYLYGDGMRRENSLATPALYDLIAFTPGPLADDPSYSADGFTDPACLATNFAAQAGDDNHDSDFWKARDLIPGAKGSNVPLLLTQGLTENNTVADGTQQYLDNHTGYERAWLGPWDHVRGNETDASGKLKMGRAGFFDEVMRFYDRFLKGIAPTVGDPPIAVQTNDGTWRSEAQWPPADRTDWATALRTGSYQDTGTSWKTGPLSSSDSSATSGVWTISPPLPYDLHLAGSGRAVVDAVTTAPNANLVVDVYDLDKDGTGPLITRQGHLLRTAGDNPVALDLWSADWRIPAGHRIAVRLTDTNQDWWLGTVPTLQSVTVKSATVTLPFLRYRRTKTIAGDPGVQLAGYLADAVVLPADLVKGSEAPFNLPPALEDAPAGSVYTGDYTERVGSASTTPNGGNGGASDGSTGTTGAPTTLGASSKGAARLAAGRKLRLVVRVIRQGRRTLIASGRAPANTSLVIRLLRNGHTVATKRVRVTPIGSFRATFRVKRAGRYTFHVTGRGSNGRALRTITRPSRVR
jgi:uncharacterized protein